MSKIIVAANHETPSSAMPVAVAESKTETNDTMTTVDDRYTQGEIRKVDIAQGKLRLNMATLKICACLA